MTKILESRILIDTEYGEGLVGKPVYDHERNIVGEITRVRPVAEHAGGFIIEARMFDTIAGKKLIHGLITDLSISIEGMPNDQDTSD